MAKTRPVQRGAGWYRRNRADRPSRRRMPLSAAVVVGIIAAAVLPPAPMSAARSSSPRNPRRRVRVAARLRAEPEPVPDRLRHRAERTHERRRRAACLDPLSAGLGDPRARERAVPRGAFDDAVRVLQRSAGVVVRRPLRGVRLPVPGDLRGVINSVLQEVSAPVDLVNRGLLGSAVAPERSARYPSKVVLPLGCAADSGWRGRVQNARGLCSGRLSGR